MKINSTTFAIGKDTDFFFFYSFYLITLVSIKGL